MKFDARRFLKAIAASETLRAYLQERHPDAMNMIDTFRRRIGDNCSYVRAGLQKVWYDEEEHELFQQHLRAAGLPGD